MNQRSLIKTDSSAQTGERRKDPDYQPREKFNQRIMKSNKGDENRNTSIHGGELRLPI